MRQDSIKVNECNELDLGDSHRDLHNEDITRIDFYVRLSRPPATRLHERDEYEIPLCVRNPNKNRIENRIEKAANKTN